MNRFKRFANKPSAGSAAGLLARAKLSVQQKIRQGNGEAAEALVELELNRRGMKLVEKVEVPFRLDKDGHQYAKRKVSGDFRAVMPWCVTFKDPNNGMEIIHHEEFGVSVLVEVKHHDDRLSWAAFRPHQILALDAHMVARGITEVAWYTRGKLHFIPWSRFREIGFGDRKSVVWTGKTIELHTPIREKRNTTKPKAIQQ